VEFFFGEYHLDIGRRELRRGADLVGVEPQVFDLLVYLVRNRDRVVSKDDLLASIWGGRIVSESTLASHVHAVRKAVGDKGEAQKLIRTLPRKGFRFIGAVEEVEKHAAPLDNSAAVLEDPSRPTLAPGHDLCLCFPGKPSVAVLAFSNWSGDPEQEYFTDGIAEDIITALSRYPSLFVTARSSSFIYKSRAVDVKQVGCELGVRYILEGGVRKSGNRIRITGQLIDAETGKHIWADRYDRNLADMFAVQDEITGAVAIAIAPAIAEAERRRAMRIPPGSLDAWAAYQRGLWHFYKIGPDNALAQKYFEQAVDIDPNFASGYKGLAAVHLQLGALGARNAAEAFGSAEALARRAVVLDPIDAEAHATLAWAMLRHGDYEGAVAEAKIALAMCPNLALAHGTLGETLIFSGLPKEGLAAVETSIRLDPHDPKLIYRLNNLALGFYFSREYEAAVEAAMRAVRANPDFPLAYRWLAAALGQLGRTAEAKKALEKAIAIAPATFDMYVRQRVPWHRPEDHAHMVDGLCKAGMPVGDLPSALTSVRISQPSDAPRLSIVVLPFTNLGDDREQEYFADGITDDLTTDLSRIAGMLVISRNTAFTYRGKPVNTRQIGRELGVRYVLEGSVRRSGSRVRISAQLIDAETDAHIWAERFEGDLSDLFALQDEVTRRIAVALELELVGIEAARPTQQAGALDYILRGRAEMAKPTSRDRKTKAISLFEQALALDPRSVMAQSWLACALAGRVMENRTESSSAEFARAEKLIGRALTASPRSPLAHFAKGVMLRAQGRVEEAIPEFETVVGFDRNWTYAIFMLGQCKLLTGLIDEAIPAAEQAIRLSPHDPAIGLWYWQVGMVHMLQSRTDEAIVWFEKARRANPGFRLPHAYLASAYALKGEMVCAAEELAEARRVTADDRYSSISRLKTAEYYGVPKVVRLFDSTYFAGLRKAGVPEE
jgi:adenylate cyclase